MQLRVRTPEPGDAGELAELAGQLGYPSSPDQIRRRVADLEAREDHFVALALTPDNKPVGWVHGYLSLRLQSDSFAEIGGLVVAENHRGRGIGALLLGAVEEWARSKNLTKVRVRSNVIRGRAHGFYLQHGYRQGKTSHVFDKSL